MKKIILLLFIITSSIGYSFGIPNEEKEKIDIKNEGQKGNSELERTTFCVEAFVIKSSSVVEVELFNIGTATVTITNSYGDIVCSTSANTSLPVVLSLAIPSEGDTYFIEISSASWYASGFFNL